MKQELMTHVGILTLTLKSPSHWNVRLTTEKREEKLEVVKLYFDAPEALVPPAFSIEWRLPQIETSVEFMPNRVVKRMPPEWGDKVVSDLAHNAPMVALASEGGENRLTFGFSDALRLVELLAGVDEETSEVLCKVSGFMEAEAPLRHYEASLWLDSRPTSIQESIRQVVGFWESFEAYRPAVVPPAARQPMYSFWYSYHQNLDAASIEAECKLAAALGMETVIVDDGWQTDDNKRGYAFCGDWEPAKSRFPDIVEHVKRVHALGVREMFWFAVPHIGFKSKSYEKFKGKYLYECEGPQAAMLDPRFPEVREYLISFYERAIRDWDLDGLKLDFIDNFKAPPDDPAVAEGYAGRDCKSVPQAVDLLMTEIMRRLTAIKPDVLIEFRQYYNGPAIRKYGNMFRVCDCPGDLFVNRVHSLDMRLMAGNTAVHSDMLAWHREDTVESAARQFLAILFSVPQISVKLALLPADHKAMLTFWLKFWRRYSKTLLDGFLTIEGLQFNATAARAEDETCCISVCYAPNQVLALDCVAEKTYFIVNATAETTLVIDNSGCPRVGVVRDTTGMDCGTVSLASGLSRIAVPVSGLIELLS